MTPRSALRPSLVGAVAVGGAIGAVLRYALTLAFPDPSDGFPWTIFAINVVGCAVLATLPAIPVLRLHPVLPPLLGPGVLGGFTTLSTFAEQARALVAGGHVVTATAYVVGSVAVGLVAVALADRLSSVVARVEFLGEEGDQ
ncbi:CrcB family protein [Nocardioides panacis]|uniref:Fluoride-specific ion channel FluC n=1 Tax=Nocardioides panacis TaxID=2849501 RepID=A0A975Y039_9ACTN|nr:CrcB family protein [Nocardioides panacis]QWZ08045.1 CrcB family protein [Nocardioides panacis]